MDLTFKNIKAQLTHFTQGLGAQPNVEFENRDLVLQGKDYFLCQLAVATIPEMAAIEDRAQPEDDWWNDRTFHLRMSDPKKSLYFGLRQADQLVAFLGCRFNAKMTRMRIMRLSVLPEEMTDSIAEALVSALLEFAAQLEVRSIFVQVRNDQTELETFYSQLGFKKVVTGKKTESETEVAEYQYVLKSK
ncbi:MAG TPA: GNAT family N-acetyltransferase [Candidatus Ligilactobacillus excrementipullorum]|nr:GNAT family N-acetyltransferase [Candidatus Ligilactobacillus excrementipullorum]